MNSQCIPLSFIWNSMLVRIKNNNLDKTEPLTLIWEWIYEYDDNKRMNNNNFGGCVDMRKEKGKSKLCKSCMFSVVPCISSDMK